ncbi:MAG: TraR/DksA C4-type zinc finger protein [Candidatus Paceibacterota bacterium]
MNNANLDDELLQQLEKQLKEEKEEIIEELKTFAKEDADIEGNWDSLYPDYNQGDAGGEKKENEAMEVEEYTSRLPVEHSLELKVKAINLALKKMEEGNYGICENCNDPINVDRLKAYPAARTCVDCSK